MEKNFQKLVKSKAIVFIFSMILMVAAVIFGVDPPSLTVGFLIGALCYFLNGRLSNAWFINELEKIRDEVKGTLPNFEFFDPPFEKGRWVMGISLLTVVTIQNNPVEIDAGGPDENGKFAGFITHNEGKRFRLILSSEPIFDSAKDAINFMIELHQRILDYDWQKENGGDVKLKRVKGRHE